MFASRSRLASAVGLVLLGLTTACGAGDGGAGDTESGGVQVVTALYPLQFVTERVAGNAATVENLTQPGAEPHDVELTPGQVADIARADLVVYEQSFQPAVDDAVAESGNDNVLDIASVVPLEPLTADDGHGHGHGDEPDHDSGKDDSGAPALDPHVWLDPTKLASITDAVAKRLAEVDPPQSAEYTRNADALTAELKALDADFTAGLESCERREFVTTHAAFGYLAKRYDLQQIAISGLSPDAEPSPARIAEVHALAREHGITTIFYETLVSPAVAKSIAADLSLRSDVLDPVEGITAESRGTDYLSVMRANLAALRTANSCR